MNDHLGQIILSLINLNKIHKTNTDKPKKELFELVQFFPMYQQNVASSIVSKSPISGPEWM